MTKKGRTFLTSFAGSIGIIGIALILALSTGINNYINAVQKDTLSSYPIQLMAEERDMSSILASLMESEEKKADREDGRVYTNTVMYELLTSYMSAETKKNNLSLFKEYIESSEEFSKYASAVQYGYHTPLYVYADTAFGIRQVEPSNVFEQVMPESVGSAADSMSSMSSMMSGGMKIWSEILPSKDGGINELLEEQYILVDGRWPSSKQDIVLILNSNNEISDLSLYSLGLKDTAEVEGMMADVLAGKKDESYSDTSYTYEEMYALSFRLMLPDDYYAHDPVTDTYKDMRENETFMSLAMAEGLELKICGIIKPNPDAVATALSGTVGYTSELTEYIIEMTNASKVVEAQKQSPGRDVVEGLDFERADGAELSEAERAERFCNYIKSKNAQEKAALYTSIISTPPDDVLESGIAAILAQYPDAESKKSALADAYSKQMGMDADSIKSYIDKMSEENINAAMREMAAEMTRISYAQKASQSLAALSTEQVAAMLDTLAASSTESTLALWHDTMMPSDYSSLSYEERIEALGVVDLDSPSSINIYAHTFEDKDMLSELITEYNKGVDEADKISYTDIVAIAMSGISTIINVISYVLIAFVSISLVVSSIMIGIITYISVLERTKEIGILRAIGASKGDISRVFNAETLIVGFVSGLFGIGFTLLACIPANAIIQNLTGISSLEAVLPPVAAAILVGISMCLTFIAGLVPSRIAAKKDPVVALRSE